MEGEVKSFQYYARLGKTSVPAETETQERDLRFLKQEDLPTRDNKRPLDNSAKAHQTAPSCCREHVGV